jgi:hypothetical protein
MAHAVFTLHGISGAGGKMLSSVIILHSIWYLFHCFLRANVIFTLDPVERYNRLNLKFNSISYDSITPQHPPPLQLPSHIDARQDIGKITSQIMYSGRQHLAPHAARTQAAGSPHAAPLWIPYKAYIWKTY